MRDGAQLETVLFGADDDSGVAGVLDPGAVVVVTSTVGEAAVVAAAQRLAERGVHTVDAPVSGGPVRAGTGDLLASCVIAGRMLRASLPQACAIACDFLDEAFRQTVFIGSEPRFGLVFEPSLKRLSQVFEGIWPASSLHYTVAENAIFC